MNGRKLAWRGGLTLALMLGGSLAMPTGAVRAADVINTFRTTPTSGMNSVSPKSVTVTCPNNTFLYGPGAAIQGGGGQVTLETMRPMGAANPTSAVVTAHEVGNYSGNWNLTATANCGPAVSNLHVEPGLLDPVDSDRVKESDARCPEGQKLYGNGFDIIGGLGNVFVHDIITTGVASLRSNTVRATEHGTYTQSWSLRSYAVCGNAASTQERIIRVSATDSTAEKSANRSCPVGTEAHGAGAQVSGDTVDLDGRLTIDRVVAGEFNGLAIGHENGTVNDNWNVTMYVVCASAS
jgi:hypothetical protein